MKKIVKILLIISFFGIFGVCNGAEKNSYKQYDKLFQAINKKRYGLTEKQIDKTQNPFILKSNKTVESSSENNATTAPTYVLKGIINNSANINGHWYRLNDAINEYKLKKIKNNSVILDNAGNSLELKLKNKGKENVTITIK